MKQQKQFVQQLLKGMSSAMACSTIDVSLDSARWTLATDARFRRKCDEVSEALTENVRASLYSKALKGIVPAQALWFKEEAARKAARQEELPLSPDELLAEIDRFSKVLQLLQQEAKSK